MTGDDRAGGDGTGDAVRPAPAGRTPSDDEPVLPTHLPHPRTRDGDERRVGVEVEFGHLAEHRAAEILARRMGGAARASGTREQTVAVPDLGEFRVYLDTRYRHTVASLLGDTGIDLARLVVPVELVTPPLSPARLPDLDRVLQDFAEAGAQGTTDGLLLGFGVHLNVAVRGLDVADLWPVMQAFAFLEDWIRRSDPIDVARRTLPFVAHWPRTLTDRLAGDPPKDADALVALCLERMPSRNHSLDLMPVLAMLDEGRVRRTAREPLAISARPAWHYRLPDCRLDDPSWSVAWEWNKWVLVEEIAARDDLLDTLAARWRRHRSSWPGTRRQWADAVDGLVAEVFGGAGG